MNKSIHIHYDCIPVKTKQKDPICVYAEREKKVWKGKNCLWTWMWVFLILFNGFVVFLHGYIITFVTMENAYSIMSNEEEKTYDCIYTTNTTTKITILYMNKDKDLERKTK